MRIFIKMDSAYRNLQGNGDELENSAQTLFVISVALWLDLCISNNQTWFFIALTLVRSLGGC